MAKLDLLQAAGKKTWQETKAMKEKFFLSNRSSCVTNFNCLEEERHHEKELVCGHSLRSDGELST